MENKGMQTKMELEPLTATKKASESKKVKELESRVDAIEKSILQLFHEVNVLYKAHK